MLDNISNTNIKYYYYLFLSNNITLDLFSLNVLLKKYFVLTFSYYVLKTIYCVIISKNAKNWFMIQL